MSFTCPSQNGRSRKVWDIRAVMRQSLGKFSDRIPNDHVRHPFNVSQALLTTDLGRSSVHHKGGVMGATWTKQRQPTTCFPTTPNGEMSIISSPTAGLP